MSFFKDRNCYMKNYNLSLKEKIVGFNWQLLIFICLVVGIGLGMLYSVGGGWSAWVSKQAIHFAASLCVLFVIAMFNLRFFMRYAYWIYGIVLLMLLCVELFGYVGMGSQRWLRLGPFQIQPSECMKIALVLALARYFHGASLDDVRSVKFMVPPILMMLVPVGLILKQPDLGTAMMLVLVSVAIFFIVGVQIWKFVLVFLCGAGALPVIWAFLHDYQKKRILTFLHPEQDPLGNGYHIMQSKITLGSGGFFGKGFMQGTQSQLGFIPEKQTDFIFTVLAEEFGLLGALTLYILYMIIIAYGIIIGLKCTSFFGKVLTLGLTVNFALYVFINMGMVMGLMPVVGVPLPLMSYGGTAMLTLFIGFGLIECVGINKEMVIGRLGSIDDE